MQTAAKPPVQTQHMPASLAHAIGHDLRAPVRAICSFAAALQQHAAGKLDADAEHYLQRINSSAQRLNTMLEGLARLLQLAQTQLQVMPVDITALCRSLLEELKVRYSHWPAQISIAPGLHAAADPALLRMALHELLDNAWKYSSGNGAALIEVSGEQHNGQLQLCIKDNGLGFDLQYATHLFAPFQHQHATSALDGPGLGLARVQQIIHLHGGQVWAEARPQQGAAFYCTLPLTA